MTTDELIKASRTLLLHNNLAGENVYLPRVYVVNGKVCWFLNQARREAYGTDYEIEEVGIKTAMRIAGGRELQMSDKVAWDFNQEGELFYGGRLFVDSLVFVHSGVIRL